MDLNEVHMFDVGIKPEKANKKFKDSMFVDLFSKQENSIELCKALLDLDYIAEDSIKNITLSDILFKNVKNDIAFMVNSTPVFIMIEHQSTLNQNMPLRFVIYLGRTFEEFYKGDNIYRNKLIEINTPLFYVFYNGQDDLPPVSYLKLSDAYKFKDASLETLELTVKVYNLNKLSEISELKDCKILNDYSVFVEKTRAFIKEFKDTNKGLEKSIEYCIEHDILKDYLVHAGTEVHNMWTQEYDYERDIKINREEAKEEGREEGREEVREEAREEGILNYVELLYSITKDTNSTISQTADKFGVSKDYVLGVVKKHNIIK